MLTATKFYRNRIRSKIIIIATIIFVAIFVFVALCISVNKNKNSAFEKKNFYILYVEKSDNQSKLLSLQDTIKKLGGGGEIFFYDKFYYLTVSMYLIKDDAIEILKNLNQTYRNAGILNLERKKLSTMIKSKVKSYNQSYRFFNLLDQLTSEIAEQEFLFMSGILTQRDLISSLLKRKVELENIINSFEYDENNELLVKIYSYQNLCLLYFNNFFGSFFESSKKNSLLCELAVNIALLSFEMNNSLKL